MKNGDMDATQRHAQAMDKIGQLVSVRERTCKELHARLTKAGFSAQEAQDAVAAAVRVGLVDERRYARSYIRGKSNSGWGRAKIVSKLKEAGIDDETIAACDDAFPSQDEELAQALKELQRKPTHSAHPRAALMRRLVGKGYSYDVARRAVETHMHS